MAELAYNSRWDASTGMSPFMAILGYKPRACDDIILLDRPQMSSNALCRAPRADSLATSNHEALYDRNRPDVQYDQVLLDTLNLDLTHIGAKGRRKCAARFIGPYKNNQRTTPDTYQISLLPGVRLHNEFHVANLQPSAKDTNDKHLNNVPRLITCDGTEGNQVRAIVG
ncbi:uncharacterized protein CCR75_002737 [Bremia lactucae]|uniref:Tf2-1-like SH3-like domain-containing protein n=1 Tax=Bremia lactucae TaxID=4779 RepID=A0A976FGS5_BRELC|nr:hypothetical protein CCR75_002737 [Bremia lactucae]